jgi:murein DD-endopeptidase MepM/ murein hydrolase activator NlpD
MTKNFNYKAILLSLTLVLFSGTIPSFISCKAVPSSNERPAYDSAKVILFLDTAVLGPFYWPVNGKVISHYGKRGQRMHTGTDIKLSHGDTVRAAFTGVVTKSEHYYGYGILVVLKHPKNLETYYSHLSKALVSNGDTIKFGTPIGLGGRTGRATTDHLHFEIRKAGKALNAEHFFNFNELNVKTWVLLKNTKAKTEKEEPASVTKNSHKKKKEPSTDALADAKKFHTIKQGDTLFSLSRRYGTTVDTICKLNNIKKSGILKVGTKLRVQ